MALHLSRGWLIAYDIADPRRLGRLHAFIKKRALPVQYSLYYCAASPARMDALMRRIETYIDPRHDDVRAYQVPANPRIVSLGRGALPDGVALLSASDSLVHFGVKPQSEQPLPPAGGPYPHDARISLELTSGNARHAIDLAQPSKPLQPPR